MIPLYFQMEHLWQSVLLVPELVAIVWLIEYVLRGRAD